MPEIVRCETCEHQCNDIYARLVIQGLTENKRRKMLEYSFRLRGCDLDSEQIQQNITDVEEGRADLHG